MLFVNGSPVASKNSIGFDRTEFRVGWKVVARKPIVKQAQKDTMMASDKRTENDCHHDKPTTISSFTRNEAFLGNNGSKHEAFNMVELRLWLRLIDLFQKS
jgi:hypothetical protein